MTITTTKNVKIDLCPKKPDKALMSVGDTRVVATITLTTNKPVAPIIMKRLTDVAAAPLMRQYQMTISKEVVKLETKLRALQASGNTGDAAEMAAATTHSIQAACKALPGAVNAAVEKQLKLDAKADKNLLEAQIKVGVAVSFKTIAIAIDATRVGLSMGADVHAIVMLCKNTKDLAVIVYDATKDEPKLKKELLTAIGEYTTSRQRKKIDEMKAEKSDIAAAKIKLKQAYQSLQPKSKAAEAARKRYRDKVTGLRHDVEKLSLKAYELDKAIKAAGPQAKNAQEARAHVKTLEEKVDAVYQYVQGCEKFTSDMAFLLAEAFKFYDSSQKVDDRTFDERIGDVETTMDLLRATKELVKLSTEIWDLAA